MFIYQEAAQLAMKKTNRALWNLNFSDEKKKRAEEKSIKSIKAQT